MTALQVIETGEMVEQMTRVEAERITARIADKLDGIADNIEQVMPLIREALTREAWKPLGYSGATAYVSERFAGAFERLPAAVRQPIVSELSSAGMSTRAIAPIVGVSQKTVVKDTQVIPEVSPAPALEFVDTRTGEIHNEPAKVTGMDGKQYTKPAPVERPEPATPRRRALPDAFFDAAYDLDKNVERLHRLVEDDRFPANKEQVARKHANDLSRTADVLADVLRHINN